MEIQIEVGLKVTARRQDEPEKDVRDIISVLAQGVRGMLDEAGLEPAKLVYDGVEFEDPMAVQIHLTQGYR